MAIKNVAPVNDDNQLTANTYDGDGNPTTYNGSAVTFDIEDRLTATSFLTAGYYDDGTRAWKQPVNGVNGYRAYFLYDGGHLVAEIEHDGTLRNLFGWGTAGLLERYQASNSISYVYTYDPSGNVVMRHDSSPSADCDYTTLYDAFGAQHGSLDPLTQTQSQQAKQDMVGYGGQWGYYTDQESVSNPTNPAVRYLWVRCGLRDYDSLTARWLERDPISYDGGVNVYSFCQNNPVTKSDASGLQSEDSLSSSLWQALKVGDVKQAFWILGQMGIKTPIYQRLLGVSLSRPEVKNAILDRWNYLLELAAQNPFNRQMICNASGGLRCDYAAQKIADVISENEVPSPQAFELVPTKADQVIRLVGENVEYDHHVFIRVNNWVLDTLTKGAPERFNIWQQRFDTGQRYFLGFIPIGRVPFNQAYKLIDVTSTYFPPKPD